MNKILFTSSLFLLSLTALADISISTKTEGSFNRYELALNGDDAKALSSVLKENTHSEDIPSGIELLSCGDETLCSIKIGADVYSSKYDLRNADLFKGNADSVLNNGSIGTALISPTSSFYLWKDTRKEHAKNDKKLFELLKNSKSSFVAKEKSALGLRLTLKSSNLNLSCLKLNDPIKFKYDIIDLGHMGGLGAMTTNISYVCQLSAKVNNQ